MTGVAYDPLMTRHVNPDKPDHVEGPERIVVAQQRLERDGLLDRCIRIESRVATETELALVHNSDYIEEVKGYKPGIQVFKTGVEQWPSYISDSTYQSAACAVGCLLNVVSAVMSGKIRNGVALVRPPGHHAEVDESCGFCFFNNVAIAARHVQSLAPGTKILILDWDIHFGNGIQHIFYQDPTVLYVSMHRFDSGDYFPNLKEANVEYSGEGKGAGFNVNIPWNKDMMGNVEYRAAFDTIVFPIANEFKPDLIMVACGFDAVAADPLGDYVLTPDVFVYMTQKLMGLAGGKLVLSLEGGYNAKAIGECLQACLQVMLGTYTVPVEPEAEASTPCKRALQTIEAVVKHQSKFWKLES